MVRQPIAGVVRGVNLAKSRGPESVLAKMRKKAGQVVGWRGSVQAVVSMIVAVLATENAGPARRANGILSVGPGESNAARGQPIHIGRNGLWVAFVSRTGGLV